MPTHAVSPTACPGIRHTLDGCWSGPGLREVVHDGAAQSGMYWRIGILVRSEFGLDIKPAEHLRVGFTSLKLQAIFAPKLGVILCHNHIFQATQVCLGSRDPRAGSAKDSLMSIEFRSQVNSAFSGCEPWHLWSMDDLSNDLWMICDDLMYLYTGEEKP